MSSNYPMKLSDADKSRWHAAAKGDGFASLAQWLRWLAEGRIRETTQAVAALRELNTEDAFEEWWDQYAHVNRIPLDTRMIHFAEDVRKTTLEEVMKVLEGARK